MPSSLDSPGDIYPLSSSSNKHELTCSIGYSVGDFQQTHQSKLVCDMENWGYTYIECPLLDPSFDWKSSLNDLASAETPLQKSEFFVQSSEFARCTVATLPQFLDFIEPGNDEKAYRSLIKFSQLVSWAGHLSLSTLQVPLPRTAEWIPEFAHQVLQVLQLLTPATTLWILVDLSHPHAWDHWQFFQSMMPSSCPCYLHLHIPTTSFTSLDPWVSTPVACMSFNLSLFDLNPKGYPLLPKPFRPCLQAWLHRLAYLTLHFDTPIHDEGPSIYKQYLNYLYRTHPVSAIDKFSYECQDLLQAPLQPLMHELDMQTYDTFERDRVKYEQYQEAIAQALIDKKHVGKVIVLMVGMGARGPLVDCCLRASDRVNVPVFIYALEKNPNAIVTLSHKQKTVWGDELVKVVFADMRTWQPPVLADIMVSELLGSFGDNELCPECLDGAQKALKENAISIPQSYGSYVAPLSSTKLYFSALKVKDPSPLEMMYVVKFHEVQILEPSKKIWDFSHPLPPHQMLPKNQHNYRHSSIHYRMTKDAVVHGFAGFFDCTLYKNITLSIVPETHTKDMLSWFPAYFPIKQPIHLLQEDEITIHLWRCIGDKKVWYEWCLLATRQGKPLITSSSTIHNSTGKTYWIGL